MSERVAVVAGAGGDLGRDMARKLAAAGFTVAGIDRREEALKELPDGTWRAAADPAAASAVVDRVATEAGPPEVLVNTVGAYRLGDSATVTREDLRLDDRRQRGPGAVDDPGVPYLPTGARARSCMWPRARARVPAIVEYLASRCGRRSVRGASPGTVGDAIARLAHARGGQ